MTLTPIHQDQPRQRRKRESFAPLSLAGSRSVPFTIGNSGEPAFHEVEEAFFKAGTEPTLQRNEGDEYEKTPGLWQRVFRKA